MAKINEEMIRKVFDEMLKHKASLTKLVVDEEEDEDISDYRMLADLIIKNYPWLRLFLDIRYFAGLNSLSNSANRNKNFTLINEFYYVDNSFKLNQIAIGASVSYTLKNSIRKIRR